ncbi:lytic transglycosylase domain-containing protein [bacterium]|nr:lytic transglycosylase domain-containing protein [bacterium]
MILIIPLLILVSSAAFADEPMSVKEYLSLRKKLLTKLPLSTLRADSGSYIGKVFEIRGTVSGYSENSSGSSLIITARNNGSFIVSTDRLPSENPPLELACLVRIGDGSTHSLSDLRLVACTYDIDLKRREQATNKDEETKIVKAEAARVKATKSDKKKDKQDGKQVTYEEFVAAYKNAIKSFNKKLSEAQADKIARSVVGFGLKYQVDPRLVCAVILAESHFRIDATSRCGAQGLGQLMPGTAAGLGVNNAYDPVENIYGSVRYIRSMIDRMVGGKAWSELTWNDLAIALAAYNAGPGAVKKHGGVPPYKETQNYVRRVVSIYKQLCGVK